MWQDCKSIHSSIGLFSIQLNYSILYTLIEVPLNRAWPTQHWEGSWECSFQLTTSWMYLSVPPRTWLHWVLGGLGRTVSCHLERPGSAEAGAGRQSRCHCQPEPLLNISGRARAHCTSSPPEDCPAAVCPMAQQVGGKGGQSTRGVGGH